MYHYKKTEAYLTVYMSLILTIMLSLCLTLIEGVRQNGIYLESECITDIGMNSILAEYHRELFQQYNLLAIDSSYGTMLPQVGNTEKHLKEYLEVNLLQGDVLLDWLLYRDMLKMRLEDLTVTKARFLTDGGGAVFRRRAAEAMWSDLSMDLYEQMKGWMKIVESEKLTQRDIEAEKKKLDEKLDAYDGIDVQISETEWVTIQVKNPTENLEKIRKKGILSWVIEDVDDISSKKLQDNDLIASRYKFDSCNSGNMELEENKELSVMLERFLFQEYLLNYMGNYLKSTEQHVIDYQIEYLLSGKKNDTDNLREVVNKIFAIREAANVSYLFSDQKKYVVAEGLGSALATAMTIPEASELLTYILLFGWAFVESIYDVTCIMSGERIPLMKTSDTWHYDLTNALKMSSIKKNSETQGLCYEDYLRVLLSLQPEDTLTMRALNMIEADIRNTFGNELFRIDGCLDGVGAKIKIKSAYGYECEVNREKSYCTQ